ncbi:MAG TPA: hypothetical protein PLO23_06935 [Alphaproteobacteria bacterium]|nr:hypothetical protein [Alphaproteobacteria bacterium]
MISKAKKAIMVCAALLALGASSAHADYFYVQDPVTDISLSYPDTWRRVYNQKTDDVMTIAAPGVENFASCRMRMRDEPRYKIYPASFDGANARDLFTEEFWTEYLAEYPLARIDSIASDGGLGRGAGSVLEATYISFDDPRQQKQAIITASLYNNKIYILDCAAKVEHFERHYPSFRNIAKSVGFAKQTHELPGGDYRNFMADDPTFIRNERYNRVRWWDGLKEYW